jgi:hypothetical protein
MGEVCTMTPGNLYRAKAADMAARARADRSPIGKAEYERLCLGYLRLAEQADQRAVVEKLPKLVEEIRTRSLLHRLLNHISDRAFDARQRRGRDHLRTHDSPIGPQHQECAAFFSQTRWSGPTSGQGNRHDH